ncbi:unnamed protein product [Prorocentrum cordatum]|uniref:NAD(P)(+)--arginine ADP-ribosyltransferase n=1 Tax=Prorocentrum cordatum TaxID=2364126 RepID=A0ABN9RLX2_9DINO|nr:unnamed protein product [Polarella glacialis]
MLEEAESEPEEEGEEVKYSVIHLVFGHPAEVTKGVEALLGITTQERISGEEKGLDAIWEEVKKAGTEKDCANLQYILHAVAQEESSLPPHVVEDYKNGCYHGGRLAEGDYDFGHAGMTFQSFMEREEAKLAGLNEPELCSIRLYTTSSFPLFNRPLRQGVKPHPMAITVTVADFLINGIKKLRAVAASKPGFQDEKRLYRGMKNADLDLVKFKAEGGAEFAAMSTTPTLEVAHSYSRSNRPLLFMFLAKGLSKGVEISWCSVYPKEDEVLYPPGTFLRYVRDKKDPEGTKIIQIEPQIP